MNQFATEVMAAGAAPLVSAEPQGVNVTCGVALSSSVESEAQDSLPSASSILMTSSESLRTSTDLSPDADDMPAVVATHTASHDLPDSPDETTSEPEMPPEPSQELPAYLDELAASSEPFRFPVSVFPARIAAYLRQVATATQTPVDFPGAAALAAVSVAIGNSRRLVVREGAWSESPCVWIGVVGEPTSGKTPAMNAVLEPFNDITDWSLGVLERPHMASHIDIGRFIVRDATRQGLTDHHVEQPRGSLLHVDEGVNWRALQQNPAERGFWLSNWSGEDIRERRRGTGAVHIRRPFTSVLFGTQPAVLPSFRPPSAEGDGSLARMLFVCPTVRPCRQWTDATVTRGARSAWCLTLHRLLSLQDHATSPVDPTSANWHPSLQSRSMISFSPEGRRAWVEWYNSHIAEIESQHLPRHLRPVWGKLTSYAARLTLILHCVWAASSDPRRPGGPHLVQAETVERMAQLIAYFKSHWRRADGLMHRSSDANRLDELLAWIRGRGQGVTVRDLLQARRASTSQEAERLLRELEARGDIICSSSLARNHRRVTRYSAVGGVA